MAVGLFGYGAFAERYSDPAAVAGMDFCRRVESRVPPGTPILVAYLPSPCFVHHIHRSWRVQSSLGVDVPGFLLVMSGSQPDPTFQGAEVLEELPVGRSRFARLLKVRTP